MGYQALYRMYRPARFGEVIGQTAVVRILKNQAMTGRVATRISSRDPGA